MGPTFVVLHPEGISLDPIMDGLAMLGSVRCIPVGDDTSVDDIDAARLDAGTDRIILLGHSTGAGLAQLYARSHAEHLTGLILCSAVPVLGAGLLAEIETPALVVTGRQDTVAPPDEGGIPLFEALPAAELCIFERSGHHPFLDQPAAFVQAIQDWMTPDDASLSQLPA
jgi:pimeloyl-ACP methyl ester carboxylesterase